VFKSFTVSDSDAIANRKLDPGESAELRLILRNAGAAVGPTSATLVSRTQFLEVLDPFGQFGPAEPGETTASVADWFRVRARPDAPVEMPAWCDLMLTGSGYADTVRVPVLVGDSMNLPAGPDAHGYRIYDWTDSCYERRADYDWLEVRGLGMRVELGDDDVRVLELPEWLGGWTYYGVRYDSISICSNGWIAAGASERCDFVNVMLPYPGAPPNIVALVWDDLHPPAGGGVWFYPDSQRHRVIVEFDSIPYFGHLGDWEKVQVQIADTSAATPTGDNAITVHFQTVNHFRSATVGLQNQDGSAGLTHVWDDNYPRVSCPLAPLRALRFETVEPAGLTEGKPGPDPGPMLRVNPNPGRRGATIRFLVAGATPASIRVYDAQGRLVRELGRADSPAGLVWDSRDQSGRNVAAGVYLVRAGTEPQAQGLKVVVLP